MKRIAIQLSGVTGAAGDDWPVTQGIPFADGDLERGTPVRVVDASGQARPTQSRCLTTWSEDLRFVRWLLVDFQAGDTDATDGLFLEYGADAQPPAPATPVRIESEGDAVVIDTGALRARIDPLALLTDVQVRHDDAWQPLWAQGEGLCLAMHDTHGQRYTSGRLPATIEVEAQGPLRVSLCLRGHLSSPAGVRFCPYILRLHVTAGRPEIRLQHTFVFDQDSDLVELQYIGVQLPCCGTVQRVAVGGDGPAHVGADELAFFQRDDEHYEISGPKHVHQTGKRTRGWASWTGSTGSALAVIRDAWQEYPKGLAVGADGLDIQVWPTSAPALAFSTPFKETALRFGGTRDEAEVVRLLREHPTAPLNLKSFDVQDSDALLWVEDMVAKHAPERAASHNDTGTDNGMGAAKTTTMLLRFAADAMEETAAEELAAVFQEPLMAPAEPEYACATGAFGHFHHAGASDFAAVDAGLDEIFCQCCTGTAAAWPAVRHDALRQRRVLTLGWSCRRLGALQGQRSSAGVATCGALQQRDQRPDPRRLGQLSTHGGSRRFSLCQCVRTLCGGCMHHSCPQ